MTNIYFVVLGLVLTLTSVFCTLANKDHRKTEELWFNLSVIGVFMSFFISVGGIIAGIWIF